MLLKIDLSKVYDSLSSQYIKNVLLAFGFAPPHVRWVVAFFSIMINGIPSSPFHPSLGIRQGDPLSPFLFVIMVEGLGQRIKKAQQSYLLRGLTFHHPATFTHQQFLNDNMPFGHPSIQEAHQIKMLLTDFSTESRASINKSKSQIFFSHTLVTTQVSISHILEFPITVLPSKYL